MSHCRTFSFKPLKFRKKTSLAAVFFRGLFFFLHLLRCGRLFIQRATIPLTIKSNISKCTDPKCRKGDTLKKYDIQQDLHIEVEKLGAKDMELCMQCGICSASCALSEGTHSFPRKIYRYIQLGLKDKLLASPEPWLCYYCGDCNTHCPRALNRPRP